MQLTEGTTIDALKAVIYARVSSGKQVEGTSLEGQREICLHKAQTIGARVVSMYEDPGVSGGYYLARPGVQAALRDLESGKANTLIIARLDRYSRDREHQAAIKKRVADANARLVFCDMEFEDTPEGELAFNIMGDFADYYRKYVRSQTMKGRRRRAEDGHQPCRTTSPFGYNIVTKQDVIAGKSAPGSEGTYEIVEERAKWIREAFRRYADGDSLRKICRWLEANEVATAKGAPFWRPEVLHGMLKNPVYRGQATFGRRETKHDETLIEKGFRRPYVNRFAPSENHVFIETPPVIDDATWERCQANFRRNKEVQSGNPKRCYLLTGLLRCPRCNRNLSAHPYARIYQKEVNDYDYHCPDSRPSRNIGRKTCVPKYYRGSKTNDIVMNALQKVLRKPESIEAALTAHARKAMPIEEPQKTQEWTQRLQELQKREQAVVQAQIAGISAGADPSQYDAVFADIAQERQELQERLQQAQTKAKRHQAISTANPAMPDSELFEQLFKRAGEVLSASNDDITTAEKRNLLAQIIQVIYPDGDTIRIQMKWLSKETVGTLTSVQTPLLLETSPLG